jgi:hypothetical protein
MRSPAAVLAVPLVLALVTAISGCPTDDGGCGGADECGALADAACDNCARLPAQLCVERACVARGDDAVDISADVSIDRHITNAAGLAFAVAVADRSCDDVGAFDAFPPGLSTLAAGQKTLEGGTFHPDVQLGRVPEGDVLVLALATDAAGGDGAVVAHGCATASAAAPSVKAAVSLAP